MWRVRSVIVGEGAALASCKTIVERAHQTKASAALLACSPGRSHASLRPCRATLCTLLLTPMGSLGKDQGFQSPSGGCRPPESTAVFQMTEIGSSRENGCFGNLLRSVGSPNPFLSKPPPTPFRNLCFLLAVCITSWMAKVKPNITVFIFSDCTGLRSVK